MDDGTNTVKFRVVVDTAGLPAEEAKVNSVFNRVAQNATSKFSAFSSFGSGFSKIFNTGPLTQFTSVFTSSFGRIGSILGGVILQFIRLGTSAGSALAGTAMAAEKAGAAVLKAQAAGASAAKVAELTAQSAAAQAANAGASVASMLGPIGLVIAAILAMAAVLVVVTGGMFSATHVAAEWGLAIFKAAQKTRFAVEELSVVKLIAEEMHVSFEQIVRSMARFEVNISRAMTNPATEAGKAFKALKIDAAEAAKDPQAAFFTMTKKLEAMKDVTERDRISLALLGRDFQQLIPVLEAMGSGFGAAMEKARRFGLVLSKDQVDSLAKVSVAFTDVRMQLKGIMLQLGANFAEPAMKALVLFSTLLESLAPAIILAGRVFGWFFELTLNGLAANIATLMTLPTIFTEIRNWVITLISNFEDLGNVMRTAAYGFVALLAGDFGTAGLAGDSMLSQMSGVYDKLKNQAGIAGANILSEYQKNFKSLTDISKIKPLGADVDDTDPYGTKTKKGPKTDLERMTEQFRRLKVEITALLDSGSALFTMKFNVEDATAFKGALEKIVSLRRELNLNPSDALPRNLESSKQLVEQLERYKKVRDAVRKVDEEAYKAAEELATLRLSRVIPILDAETRATLGYERAVDARRNAEQQLTADVLVQSKLREDAIKDEVGSTLLAYNELRLDAVKQAEDARTNLIKAKINFLTAFGGESSFKTQLEAQLKVLQPDKDKGLTHLQTIEGYVKEINDALHGRVNNPAGSDVNQVYGTGRGSGGYLNSGTRSTTDLRTAVEVLTAAGANVRHTTDGKHNVGSLHPLGLAADISPMSNAELARFRSIVEPLGFRVGDERTRPKGQKVWGGAHEHVSWARGFSIPGVAEAIAGRGPQSPSWLGAMESAFNNPGMSASGGGGDILSAISKLSGVNLTSLRASGLSDNAQASGLNELTKLKEVKDALVEDEKVEAELKRAGLTSTREMLQLDVAILEQTKRRTHEAEAERTAIALLKTDLLAIRGGDPEAVARVTRNAEQGHLLSQIGDANKVIELQYEIAHANEGAADRSRVAWLQAYRDIQKADEDATLNQIKDQVLIADQSVFHAGRAKAAIMDHVAQAKGYTEIFADAITSAMDGISSGWSKLFSTINSGLGAFGTWITQIETNLLTMVSNRLLMKLVDFLLGGSASSSGGGLPIPGGSGGGGGSSSSSLQSSGGSPLSNFASNALRLLTGRGGNSGPIGGGNSNEALAYSTFLSGGLVADGGGLGGTLSGDASQASALHEMLHSANSGVQTGAAAASGGMASLTPALAAMLPMLGLSLGSSLGGQSKVGKVIGGIGGLIAGGVGAALLAPGLFAATGILGSMGPMIAGLLTNPFTAVAAGALIIGAIILGKNAARRKDEETRNQLSIDSFAALDKILHDVSMHKMDGAEGLTQAMSIRSQYLTQAGALKDKKTRNIALADVSRLDVKINAIKQAATTALNDNNRGKALVPEFATGGIVPGPFGAPRLVIAHGGEIFAGLNASQQMLYGTGGGANGGGAGVTAGGRGDGGQSVSLDVELSLGTDTQNQLFVNGAKSNAGYKVTIKNINDGKKYGDL